MCFDEAERCIRWKRFERRATLCASKSLNDIHQSLSSLPLFFMLLKLDSKQHLLFNQLLPAKTTNESWPINYVWGNWKRGMWKCLQIRPFQNFKRSLRLLCLSNFFSDVCRFDTKTQTNSQSLMSTPLCSIVPMKYSFKLSPHKHSTIHLIRC